jgi:hypothetical protein
MTDSGTGSIGRSSGSGTSVRGSGSAGGSSNDLSAGSACRATADAARSASSLYFVNSGFRSYPVKWSEMTASNPAIYNLAANVVVNAGNPKELDGRGWKLIMSGGGANKSTFTCG